MSDPALSKRLAEGVMGWHQCDDFWEDAKTIYMRIYDWHPDTDIAQAMMVAERIGSEWSLRRIKSGEYRMGIIVHGPNGTDILYGTWEATAPMALATAADSWLRSRDERR